MNLLPMNTRLPFVLSLGALTLGGCKPLLKAPDSGSIPLATPANVRAAAPIQADATASPVAARILAIVAEQLDLNPDKILLTSTWQQLGADSLDAVELVMAFEEEFHVEIPDERADAMKTVGDAVAFLSQHAKP